MKTFLNDGDGVSLYDYKTLILTFVMVGLVILSGVLAYKGRLPETLSDLTGWSMLAFVGGLGVEAMTRMKSKSTSNALTAIESTLIPVDSATPVSTDSGTTTSTDGLKYDTEPQGVG